MYIVKPIPSQVLSVKKVSGQILASMERVEKEMLKDFEKTTETWKEHKAETKFEHRFFFSGGNATIEFKVHGEIWNYLNGGTWHRYAIMEPGFRPKTKPGWIGSGPGRGSVLRDKRGNPVINKSSGKRGIDPRHWTDDIADKFDDVLQKALDEAIRKGLA